MTKPATILAFDPSSTRTGYALLTAEAVIVQAGTFKVDEKARSEVRILEQCQDAIELLSETIPDHVVIEITSGKVGRRHLGGGAGLAVYGMAVGALVATCLHAYGPAGLHLVPENLWTGGRRKRARQLEVAARFPGYKDSDDKGGDVSDAIGLACWFVEYHGYAGHLDVESTMREAKGI